MLVQPTIWSSRFHFLFETGSDFCLDALCIPGAMRSKQALPKVTDFTIYFNIINSNQPH